MVRKSIPHLAVPATPKPVRIGGGFKIPLTPIKKVKKGPVATRLPAAALAPSRRRAPMGRKKARFSAAIKTTRKFEEESHEFHTKRQAANECALMQTERSIETLILKKLKNPQNKKIKHSFQQLFSSRTAAVQRRLVFQNRHRLPVISPVQENQYFSRLALVAVDMKTD
eukprot:GHVT01050144.1.p1 GENE.GHVT01050144.1~~GHVT01050144.1.p1  ORF type:complete len:169 (+),score=33.88 GHVT01050144.1:239-745(+)